MAQGKHSRESKGHFPTEAQTEKREKRAAQKQRQHTKQQAYTTKAKEAERARFQLLKDVELSPDQEAEARLAVRRCRMRSGGPESLGADDHYVREYQCALQVDLVLIEGVSALRCNFHGFVTYDNTEVDTMYPERIESR